MRQILYLAALLVATFLLVTACSGPEGSSLKLPPGNLSDQEPVATREAEPSLAVVAEEADPQRGAAASVNQAVAAAASASDAQDAVQSDQAVVEAEIIEAEPEPAVVEINWLTVTDRVEVGLAAIGNPDAPLVITEFSDFM